MNNDNLTSLRELEEFFEKRAVPTLSYLKKIDSMGLDVSRSTMGYLIVVTIASYRNTVDGFTATYGEMNPEVKDYIKAYDKEIDRLFKILFFEKNNLTFDGSTVAKWAVGDGRDPTRKDLGSAIGYYTEYNNLYTAVTNSIHLMIREEDTLDDRFFAAPVLLHYFSDTMTECDCRTHKLMMKHMNDTGINLKHGLDREFQNVVQDLRQEEVPVTDENESADLDTANILSGTKIFKN